MGQLILPGINLLTATPTYSNDLPTTAYNFVGFKLGSWYFLNGGFTAPGFGAFNYDMDFTAFLSQQNLANWTSMYYVISYPLTSTTDIQVTLSGGNQITVVYTGTILTTTIFLYLTLQ